MLPVRGHRMTAELTTGPIVQVFSLQLQQGLPAATWVGHKREQVGAV